ERSRRRRDRGDVLRLGLRSDCGDRDAHGIVAQLDARIKQRSWIVDEANDFVRRGGARGIGGRYGDRVDGPRSLDGDMIRRAIHDECAELNAVCDARQSGSNLAVDKRCTLAVPGQKELSNSRASTKGGEREDV